MCCSYEEKYTDLINDLFLAYTNKELITFVEKLLVENNYKLEKIIQQDDNKTIEIKLFKALEKLSTEYFEEITDVHNYGKEALNSIKRI